MERMENHSTLYLRLVLNYHKIWQLIQFEMDLP